MMQNILIYPVGCIPASHIAGRILAANGIAVTDHVTPEVTHLLTDVPSFSSEGVLKSGTRLNELLQLLPPGITLIGGNIPAAVSRQMPCIDLLTDDAYLHENAALTAACALRVAAEKMRFSFRSTPVLVIGWGRIGKHLCDLLTSLGARVTLLSRTAAHRAEAASFGLSVVSPQAIAGHMQKFRILFNTAPGIMLPASCCAQCSSCLKIDLASIPGIAGSDVISARGLPGLHVPESAGELIAQTVLRLLREEGI